MQEENMKWHVVAEKDVVQTTINALKKNNINAFLVDTAEEAKKKILEIIPHGAEVMTMTSVTLEEIGISKEINESDAYHSLRNKLMKMDRNTQSLEMQKLGAAPEWTIGSVHAVTQEGQVFIASNTGSQLSAEVYASPHVVLVVGTQKIVKDNTEALKRIYEYVLPLETKRARKAYGLPDDWSSFVSKLLIINREVVPDRITLVF